MKSSTDWNADTARVLTFYKNLLSVIGLWVLDEKNIFSRLRWFLATIIEVSFISKSISKYLFNVTFFRINSRYNLALLICYK